MDAEFADQDQTQRFLAQTEHLTVSQFIKPWITQKCFPMLIMEELEIGQFSMTQSCVVMSEETRDILWPLHVTYRTSSGKTGSLVFSERSVIIEIEIGEDEAVWFNMDMLEFFIPIPSGPYFYDKLIPNISTFSGADQYGMLLVMSKIFGDASVKEVLVEFQNSDSLAVKYLSDEISNRIQLYSLEPPMFGQTQQQSSPFVCEVEFVSSLHTAPFNRYLQSFIQACTDCTSVASIDTQTLKIHAQHICQEVPDSPCTFKLLDTFAENMALSQIPIDIRLVVIQAMCLPNVFSQRPLLVRKVEEYFSESDLCN